MSTELPLVQVGDPYGGGGETLTAICWTLASITTILVGLRVYIRLQNWSDKRADWAFRLSLVGWVLAITGSIFQTVACAYGMGNGSVVLSLHNYSEANKYVLIALIFTQLASAVGKSSVASFLMVVQGSMHPRLKYLLYFVAIGSVLVSIGSIFDIMFLCTPIQAAWDPTVEGDCWGYLHVTEKWAISSTTFLSTCDLILAIYPTFIIVNLQCSMRLKMLLCGVLSLGVLAGGFGYARMSQLILLYGHSFYTPVEITLLCIFAITEMWLVIFALSVPPVGPLISRLMKSSADQSICRGDYHHGTRHGKNFQDVNERQMSGSEWSRNSDEIAPAATGARIAPAPNIDHSHAQRDEESRISYP